MIRNICFNCKIEVSLHELQKHFMEIHQMIFENGDCYEQFHCGISNCNQIVSSYRALRRHMTNVHVKDSIITSTQSQDNLPIENLCDNFFVVDTTDNTSDIRELIQKLICTLRSETSVSEKDFKHFIKSYAQLNKRILKYFDIDDIEIKNVSEIINQCKTFEAQKQILQKKIKYVVPLAILLDQKTEIRIRNGLNVLKTTNVTFHYIPIIKTIVSILNNQKLFNLIQNEKSIKRNKNSLKSFIDTEKFKNCPFYTLNPRTIRLNLYYDEIELVNPLSSKKGFHKLTVFYFTIPSLFNTELKNIYLLLICYSWDVKRYGFEKILQQLVYDLEILEKGIDIKLANGQKFNLIATLECVCGDNLATKEILGFLSPACKYFCLFCMISRQQLKEPNTEINNIQKRSKQLHHTHVDKIAQNSTLSKDFGVKEDSILNKLARYHVINGSVYDIMHDLLEGVVPYEIKLVLGFLISQNLFTVEQLNQRISTFRYGSQEAKNKPSPNFSLTPNSVNRIYYNQNAVQSWLLLRAFPFLIEHLVTHIGSEHLHLLLLLNKIVEICFASEINDYMLCELTEKIRTHKQLFLKLFPDKKFINKHHHMEHYVDLIKMRGPLINYCCLVYESKLGELKRLFKSSMNYINLPYSITKRQAFLQCQHITHQNYLTKNIEVISSKKVSINSCLSKTY